jgi:hypothetical protein
MTKVHLLGEPKDGTPGPDNAKQIVAGHRQFNALSIFLRIFSSF